MQRISQIIVIVLALVFAGCAGTRSAYQAAEGIDETAKVMAEHYYAVIREANTLSASGLLTGSALAKAQDVVRATQPFITELAAASRAYTALQNAETEADLSAAISAAAIAISKLIDVVKGSNTSALYDSLADVYSRSVRINFRQRAHRTGQGTLLWT